MTARRREAESLADGELFASFVDSVLPAACGYWGRFLVANVRLLGRFLRFLRLRSTAVLTWPGRRTSFYEVSLGWGSCSASSRS